MEFLTITLDNYGLEIEAEWAYLALDWKILLAVALLIVGRKIWKVLK